MKALHIFDRADRSAAVRAGRPPAARGRAPLAILALVGAMVLPGTASAWPWSKDMANYIAIKPQAHPMAFPQRSIPVPGTATVYVADRDEAAKLANPLPATGDSVEKGHQLFTIYCVPCHGVAGTGNGLVGEKLMLRPKDLTAPDMKDRTDGYIFGTITFGGAIMPVYANDLSPTERWHVVNYVRNVLGRSAAPAQARATK
jgi:mono/diheme cytochrome c family protein